MLLKLLKNNWQYVIIMILFVLMGTMANFYMAEIEDRRRLESNVEQLTMNYQAQILEIKDEAQKRYLISQDSLAVAIIDSLNLRPIKVERIFNTKYVYVHDTVFVELTPDEKDSTYSDFNHVFDPCASIKGKVNWEDHILIFEEFKQDINTTSVYYWDRKHRFLWIFSKKQHHVLTNNNCTGESTLTDITFVK